jgi:hypothetical protein
MTDLRVSPRHSMDTRRAWFTGGVLLLVTAVLVLATQTADVLQGAGNIIRMVTFAAALMVFAFGVRGVGSITGRRPLGTVTLTLLAVWVLLEPVLNGVFAAGMTKGVVPSALMIFGFATWFLKFGLALIAVMQIARAGVVPTPWNWAPAAVLAAVSVSWILLQIVGISIGASPEPSQFVIIAAGTVDGLVHLSGVVFLGVLAIVLADRAGRPHREVPTGGTVDAD